MTSQLPSTPIARLTGHKGPIHALTYSAGTGQYLLSGSSDRTINLYNPSKAPSLSSEDSSVKSTTPSPALVQSYTGAHAHEILTLAVASDNSRFVSGGGDKTVFLWDVATAKTLRRYGGGAGGHGGRIECVAFGGEGDSVVVSGSFDSSVRLWDTKSRDGRPLMVLSEARDSVSCLVVGEAEVVAGSVDGRVRGYDLRMGVISVDVIGKPVTSLTATLHSDSVLVSTLDSTLRLMERSNGKLLQSYTDPDYANTTYRIRSTLGARDSIALSGSEDGWIYAWDVLSGRRIQRVRHGEEQPQNTRSSKKVVSALSYKKKTNEWASAGGDGTIVIWGMPP